jgi:hypothetical protein
MNPSAPPATATAPSSSDFRRINGLKLIAPTAAEVDWLKIRALAYSPVNATPRAPSWITPADPEFHLPDETRNFILPKLICLECGWQSMALNRVINISKSDYSVCCSHCHYNTPYFKSSQDAITYWKALCLLSSP